MLSLLNKAQGEQQLEQKNQENGKDGEEEEENEKNLSLWEQFPFDDTVFAFNKKSKGSIRKPMGRIR